jgi:hypothetical protein
MIGEYHFGALDRGPFHTGLRSVADQAQRAEVYKLFVRSALNNPHVVGAHWFTWSDEPTTGRGDGENYQIGFVDTADTPYSEIVGAARQMGAELYHDGPGNAECNWIADTDYATGCSLIHSDAWNRVHCNVGVNLTRQECCDICKNHTIADTGENCTFAVFGTPTEVVPRSCWLKTGDARKEHFVYAKGATTCCPVGTVCPRAKPHFGKTDDGSIDEDLRWVEHPQSWHQRAVRILDHQFSTFAELKQFATNAKKAGVSVVQLVGVQKRASCPGPWYGGLQLCDHINGSFPAMDGTLEEWQAMVKDLKPLRFMWWTNLAYWSAQGPVFKQALADTQSGVGRFFSWTDTPSGLPLCAGRYSNSSQAAGFSNPCGKDSHGAQRCAQGSWGSIEASASADANFSACACHPGYPGKCIPSALANLGHREYFDYLVDALANSWSRNLAMDGYFIVSVDFVYSHCNSHERYPLGPRRPLGLTPSPSPQDTSMQVPCMPGLDPHFTAPNGSETVFFRGVIGRVRETQPQIVLSGEDWASWDDVIERNAQLGGVKGGFAAATQQAVLDKDLSKIEPLVGSTDGAALTCYLHPGLDGQQPGGCPTLSHRDTASPMLSVRDYRMWVAVEAATGIISQHQVKTCGVWNTPQMGVDPSDKTESPLWAFEPLFAIRTPRNCS